MFSKSSTRRLHLEPLENRQLLAGDIAATLSEVLAVPNSATAEPVAAVSWTFNLANDLDVDQSGTVDAHDFDAVVDFLNGNDSQASVDVNGDGRVTAIDALLVANYLNRPYADVPTIAAHSRSEDSVVSGLFFALPGESESDDIGDDIEPVNQLAIDHVMAASLPSSAVISDVSREGAGDSWPGSGQSNDADDDSGRADVFSNFDHQVED